MTEIAVLLAILVIAAAFAAIRIGTHLNRISKTRSLERNEARARRRGEEEAHLQSVGWTCGGCDASIGPDFDACWSCGTSRAGAPAKDFQPAVEFHPLCDECGHILIGAAKACPECGHKFDRADVDTPRALPRKVRRELQ